MNSIKEKLSASLGLIGVILWYIIAVSMSLAPLICVFRFGFVVNLVLIAVMTSMPVVGSVVELVLWVWSFFVAINMPFDVFMLVYYIALLVFVLTKVVPAIQVLFEGRK